MSWAAFLACYQIVRLWDGTYYFWFVELAFNADIKGNIECRLLCNPCSATCQITSWFKSLFFFSGLLPKYQNWCSHWVELSPLPFGFYLSEMTVILTVWVIPVVVPVSYLLFPSLSVTLYILYPFWSWYSFTWGTAYFFFIMFIIHENVWFLCQETCVCIITRVEHYLENSLWRRLFNGLNKVFFGLFVCFLNLNRF